MTDQVKLFGNLFDNPKGMTGNMKINDADFKVDVEPNPTIGTKREYYKFTAQPVNGGNGNNQILGSLFRSDKFWNVIGKPGIDLLFKVNIDGRIVDMKVTGFLRDKKWNGEPAKSPFYSLSPSKPREGAAAPAAAAPAAGHHEMPGDDIPNPF